MAGSGVNPNTLANGETGSSDTEQDDQHSGDRQRQAGAAAERIAGGADHEEHERLRGK